MWNKAEELAEGVFEYRKTGALISEEVITASVRTGETCSGSFFVEGIDGRAIKGSVYASSIRISFEKNDFYGTKEEVVYSFDSTGLADGDVCSGEICVVCSGGEYVIPFSINVGLFYENSSLGEIKNLFHFANLASSQWGEAFRLFKSPEFRSIIFDREYLPVYEMLSKHPVKEQHLEEFLITVRKKHPVTISISEAAAHLKNIRGSSREKIVLRKDIWGYIEADITTDAPFIKLERQRITTEDFIGSTFELGYVIEEQLLGDRKNFGRIYFRTPYQTLVYEVAVDQRKAPASLGYYECKACLRQMAELYLSFKMKKINFGIWINESLTIAEHMEALAGRDEAFRSSLTEEDIGKLLYLKEHLLAAEKNKKDAGKLHRFFLGLEPEGGEEEEAFGLKKLEQLFGVGCTSPLLYLEAWERISADPLLMARLTGFEIQVLWWAVKTRQLTKEAAAQFFEILDECRSTHPLIYKIIDACFEALPGKESVAAVCRFLIKNSKAGKNCFPWYRAGVENDLKITRLYEYYMDSIDLEYTEQLPQTILMYFLYNNSLDSRRKAFLYANVMRYREENPSVYRSYWKYIERFMMDELKKKKINEDLAYIYETALGPETMTSEVREPLSELIFTYRLDCDNPMIKSIVVAHGEFEGEETCQLSDGKAYIRIYTDDHQIILQDADGNRFVNTIPYTLTRLIRGAGCEWKCFNLEDADVKMLIHLYASGMLKDESAYNSFSLYERAVSSQIVKPACKKKIIGEMINDIYERKETKAYAKHLFKLDYAILDPSERGRAVEILIVSEENERAYGIIRKYGPEGVGVKKLLKLCVRKIYLNEEEREEFLLALCAYVFIKGKYEATILKYLEKYYEGPTGVLLDLWKALESFEIEDSAFTEKLLVQSVWTGYQGGLKDVFDAYYRRGARRTVTLAYLSRHAHAAFMKGKAVPDDIYGYIVREYEGGEQMNDICLLALLKHYSARRDLEDWEKRIAHRLLDSYLSKGMCFGFFKDFGQELVAPHYLEDRSFVEYRADPANRVVIHYMLEGSEKDGDRYTEQVMENVYGGIFVKDFILFFGDVLRYYITEETPTGEELVKNGKIKKTEICMDSQESRFALINDMMASRSLQDEHTLARMADKYARLKYIAENMFNTL